jgi:outer membrane protein assembly complex protein YaeT
MKLLNVIALSLIVSMGASRTWADPTGVQVDHVIVKGVESLSKTAVEALIDVLPGEAFDRHNVLTSEEKIQTFYKSHGYEEMTVESRLIRKLREPEEGSKKFENTLNFIVNEGKPVRIAAFDLVQDQAGAANSQFRWAPVEHDLKGVMNLGLGDLLEQQKLEEVKHAIQEVLVGKEFIGAGVTDIRVIAEDKPGVEVEKKFQNTLRWVKVQFSVDLGDQVSFGFRGNSALSWYALKEAVNEQRAIGLGKDYLQSVRKRLEETYHAAGYAKVAIDVYTVEELKTKGRRVIYSIQEGPKVKIESLTFDGNSFFSTDELREQFYSRASALVQNGVYVEQDVQKAAELLTQWIKEKGFLTSKLVTVHAAYGMRPRAAKAESAVNLVIYIYEGNQTRLRRVSFKGLTVLTEDQAKSQLGVKEDQLINIFALGEGLDALKRRYRDLGYLDFQITNQTSTSLIEYSQENKYADLNLDLSEGPQFKVSRIEVEGLVHARSEVVYRELSLHENQILAESTMAASERQLRKLGIFSSVAVRAVNDPVQSDRKVVLIKVVESDRGMLMGGPGIRNDLGLRAFGQLTYSDLWGLNHTASASVSANRRFQFYNFGEYQVQLAYEWPWFLVQGLTFKPLVSIDQTQYLNFTANSISTSFAADRKTVSLTWEKPILARPSLLGSFTYSLESIRQFLSTNLVDNSNLLIGTVTPRLTLDMRDNSLLPTSGLYSTTWFDFVPSFFGSYSNVDSIGYYRVQFRADYYVPVIRGFVLYFSFRTGFEQSLVKTDNQSLNVIPLIKQFFLGGNASLRGWNEGELNTGISQQMQRLSNNIVQGSVSYINYRTQLDFPVAGSLKGDVFLDAANLLINDYSLNYMFYGAGFGIRYQTPVGSVNVDWGFKLNPPPGLQDLNVIHFSVGVI